MEKNIENAIRLYLSTERISSYGKDLSIDEQLKNYNANIELCKSFYILLDYFEITFRNAIDIALTEFARNSRFKVFLSKKFFAICRKAKEI